MPVLSSKAFARLAAIGLMTLIAYGCASGGPGASHRDANSHYVKPATSKSYDSAIRRYRELHEEDPQDLNSLLALGRTLRYAGRGDEALTVLNDSKETFGADQRFLTELGKANLVAGNLSEARDVLTQSVEGNDRNWQAYSALGVANDLLGDHDQAGAAYHNALKTCPDSAAILNNLGLSMGYTGDVEQAIALLEKASSMQPKSARISQNLSTFRTLRADCRNCSAKQYKKLVGSIYPRDWSAWGADLSCRQGIVTAEEISAALNAQSFVDMRVNFAFDSAELLPEAREALDQLGKAMTTEELNAYRFRLEGHTDAVGTDDYNQGLSERRAASVKRYLVETLGIASERLETVGYGESKLLDPDHPYNGINRRVRVVKLTTS